MPLNGDIGVGQQQTGQQQIEDELPRGQEDEVEQHGRGQDRAKRQQIEVKIEPE